MRSTRQLGIGVVLCAGMLVLLGNDRASAVPAPRPLEIRLDLASVVVLARITAVEKIESPEGAKRPRVTLSVKEMLKGVPAKTIEAAGNDPYGYRVGESGIWLINAEGALIWPHGHLWEDQLPEVRQILKMLSERTWSGEVNGLKAWATVVVSPDLGSHILLFAVRNCTTKDIFLPRPNCRASILTAVVRAGDGKEYTRSLKDGEPCRVIHCDRLPAGRMQYLFEFYCSRWNKDLPPGKYTVTVTYRNQLDGELLTAVGMPAPPVTAWKGELTFPPLEMVLTARVR